MTPADEQARLGYFKDVTWSYLLKDAIFISNSVFAWTGEYLRRYRFPDDYVLQRICDSNIWFWIAVVGIVWGRISLGKSDGAMRRMNVACIVTGFLSILVYTARALPVIIE